MLRNVKFASTASGWISETRGGYVEIATDEREGLIYVLYEEDWGKYDHLAVFNYAWLTSD